eukprot:3258907-Prymnesium_polylepis.1
MARKCTLLLCELWRAYPIRPHPCSHRYAGHRHAGHVGLRPRRSAPARRRLLRALHRHRHAREVAA